METFSVNILNPNTVLQFQPNFQGVWLSTTTYSWGQVVQRSGNAYICTVSSSTGVDPASDVDPLTGVGTDWDLLAVGGQSSSGIIAPYGNAPYVKSIANNGSVSVGTTSTFVLPSNTSSSTVAGRSQFWVYNNSIYVIYLSYGSTAEVNSGVRINPNGGMHTSQVYQGELSAIAVGGTALLTYVEV